MESKRLSFALDGDQIDYKSYSKKDFLELSMKAISDANPNRNNSWFTKEAIQKAIESGTCKNKPVLGYFENDDFVSHNGSWKRDSETGVDYWDTLGTKGERILGVIREKDDIESIVDEKGQTWLSFSCALWVQYGFKQVKRLLKDARRAKNNGGSAKNISVEVDITDYEELPNGVMKINEFNLVGVTILGSRNGAKVEPGIEGADLSVIDIMGKDIYDRQMQGLRLAYEKLDGPTDNKEVFGKMEQDELIKENFDSSENSELENKSVEETVVAETYENSEGVVNQEPAKFEGEEDKEGNNDGEDSENKECEEKKDCEEKQCEEEVCPECGKNPCECEKKEEEVCKCEEDGQDKEEDDADEDSDDSNEEDEAGKDDCEKKECNVEFAELQVKYEAVVKELEECKANYDKLAEDAAILQNKVAVFEHKEFLGKASALIASACDLTTEQTQKFYSDCESGEIKDLDDLKTKVAVASFENTKKTVDDGAVSFEADICVPTVNSDVKTAKLSRWERMKKNVNKE